MIYFTRHAQNKFFILQKHGIFISKNQVKRTIENPEHIDYSRLPLLIAQSRIDTSHILRVVYKQESDAKKVITFYPGRIKQYGFNQ